ncbi:retrograde regulation protein 2 [Purpureocillium lavendulum]|uniref:Retrograde regulation protein 2 n=1 Tax=Purpureocillium lavendulum TaxID=1247861 RepID=A0AB34FXF0_9HYPO|nr:retrograde regulation protein 2 [Purpureocillium lavendulum]
MTQQFIRSADNLADDDLICFPATIAGYSLATKHFGFFAVDDFQDVSWEEEEARKLFESSQKINESECVAEILHRPLYRISGSDLGSELSSIEDKLLAAFDRISRWKAILLLDEADAFMAQRDDDSLDRNALVASTLYQLSKRPDRTLLTRAEPVLLRLLEYQSGIVILTTNRQSHFYPAFSSRIHVSINLPALSPQERQVIWRSHDKKATSTSLSDDDFASLSRLDMDGRRIKNALHVAELYARGSSELKPLAGSRWRI